MPKDKTPTETPWITTRKNDKWSKNELLIVTAESEEDTQEVICGAFFNEANADLIVEAVNNHAKLLEAAKLTMLYFDIMKDILKNSCDEHRAKAADTRTLKNRTLDDVFDELYPKLEIINKELGEKA